MQNPLKILNGFMPRAPVQSTSSANRARIEIDQHYDETKLDLYIHRDDVVNFLVKGIVCQAFADGFSLKDSKNDDEEVEWVEEFTNDYDYVRGTQIERGYGCVTICHFIDTPSKTTRIMNFKPQKVVMKVDDGGDIEELTLREEIPNHQDYVHHIHGKFKQEDNSVKEYNLLGMTHHVVVRKTDKRYIGRSIIEPIFNVCNGRHSLINSLGIFVGRVSAGIRKAHVHVRDENDDSVVAAHKLGMKNLEAEHTTVILRSGFDADGNPWRDELEIDTGNDFNFTDKLDIYHKALAGQTSIPKNYWDGQFAGTLGADAVLKLLFSTYKLIQNDTTPWLIEVIKKWCSYKEGKEWKDSYYLEWNLQPQLSDKEKAEIKLLETSTYIPLVQAMIMTVEEAREKLGFEGPLPAELKVEEEIEQEEEDPATIDTTQEDSEGVPAE